VAVVGADGDATVFVEPAAIDCWPDIVAAVSAQVTDADAIVVSGVVPAGAPDNALSTLVAIARRAGTPVLVDSSGPALADALSARPTMIKPNADELAEATGIVEPVQAARSLARTHDTVVVASLGADGVVAATRHDAWRARPARVLVGNPTGAGDALVAGLARGLRNGFSLPQVLPDCVALSAAAVLSPCAGEVDLSDYAAQREGVVVHALDPVQ
jgi:tagatose 6-phosphate kinase